MANFSFNVSVVKSADGYIANIRDAEEHGIDPSLTVEFGNLDEYDQAIYILLLAHGIDTTKLYEVDSLH